MRPGSPSNDGRSRARILRRSVEPGESYALTAMFVLADIVMAIIVLVRRHHIEPEPAAEAATAPSG